MPFAAFFVAVCLVLCIFDAARKAAICILLGAVVGMASVLHTANRLERIRVQYAARPLVLTVEVESVSDSYYPGVVDAVLRVEKVNGAKTSFRVECETLPECEAGQRVQGRFVLSVPAQQSRVGLYADGIVLLAEPDEEKPDFKQLGQSSSFRARTHRLQQRLSAALRRRMDGIAVLQPRHAESCILLDSEYIYFSCSARTKPRKTNAPLAQLVRAADS